MPPSSFDRDSPSLSPSHPVSGSAAPSLFVAVVGRSPVNLVVLSRIAERAGMKALTEAPEAAAALIERVRPAVIVLDGGPYLQDCEPAMDCILAQKRLNPGSAPFVIMLTPNNERPGESAFGGVIDAYVSKPVTPERLQPVIEQVRDRLRR